MVELQILNKILAEQDDSILTRNSITDEFFPQYQDEFKFIQDHKQKYGKIPDKETFIANFNDFDFLNVEESEDYLVDTIREEHLFAKSTPILNKLAEMMQTNSCDAISYLKSVLPQLRIAGDNIGVDIIKSAKERYDEWKITHDNPDEHFIPSGFEELDDAIGGFHMGEELILLFARTGQGKTWVAVKMLEHSWKMNRIVGLVEPEMSAVKTGYRFDTLHKHISNTDLIRGNDIKGYDKYINRLSQSDIPFYVAHPHDFSDGKVTVTKLRDWVINKHIDFLAIDGISYMTDERRDKRDSKTDQLTHIAEDLMQLSIDLKIPVMVIAQSNREGTMKEDLDLENIRDSDGIAYNASLVLSVQQKEEGLQLAVNKSRNSSNHVKLMYMWEADTGQFSYIPDTSKGEDDVEKAENLRRRYNDEDGEY